ncbi:MAG: hypothetical protein R3B95_20210 [Nitrospirales bacterium]|nr:hypothetical protein [Nitrospirales bacterium]
MKALPLTVTIGQEFMEKLPMNFLHLRLNGYRGNYYATKLEKSRDIGNGTIFYFSISCYEAMKGHLIVNGVEEKPIVFGDIWSKTSTSFLGGR